MSLGEEGWFCPSCQAFHGPHVDTCEIPRTSEPVFQCNICGTKAGKAIRCGRGDCMTLWLVNGVASRMVQ